MSCSPRGPGSLAPVARRLLCDLSASVGAPGPHDFAVRESVARLATPRRPPHPAAYVRDDRDTPLLWRRDGANTTTDLGFGKSEIFLRKRLDTKIAKLPVGQISRRFRLLMVISCPSAAGRDSWFRSNEPGTARNGAHLSARIETPHPSRTSRPRHLLPQGEKEGRPQRDRFKQKSLRSTDRPAP